MVSTLDFADKSYLPSEEYITNLVNGIDCIEEGQEASHSLSVQF